MDNNLNRIDTIKSQVSQLIEANLIREVAPETKYNASGIYMIYIDDFTSESIIPIYIGKTVNVQRRYKEHYSEILALNRLSYDEYYKYFFSKGYSFYEGRFKSCKIFKYMVENNCTLDSFHMIVLEEVEEENLDKKEQEYFQKLLPSFFGFNQLNSFLKMIQFRYSNSHIHDEEVEDLLELLMEDIIAIDCYYKYGLTRFNFEHSLPKNIDYLLKGNNLLNSKILSKYDEVKLRLDELCKRYLDSYEKTKRMYEKINRLYEVYEGINDEYEESLALLEHEVSLKLKDLDLFNEKVMITFIKSIVHKDSLEFKNVFNEYLRSKKCKSNFYKIFSKEIKGVKKKLKESNRKYVPYETASYSHKKREEKIRAERYKMIFPSCRYSSFPLKDRNNNLSIKINEDYELSNTCHINIYISNNARSDNIPFIIRFDYCYIDFEGNKLENIHYIKNEITQQCNSGIGSR